MASRFTRILVAVLLLCLVPLPASASWDPEQHVYREVSGVSLAAYVFYPPGHGAGAGAPTILLFHGGGWSAGTPEWTFGSAKRFAGCCHRSGDALTQFHTVFFDFAFFLAGGGFEIEGIGIAVQYEQRAGFGIDHLGCGFQYQFQQVIQVLDR